jgi:hypothetical protein
MRKIGVVAIAAAIVAVGVGVWADSATKARVAPSIAQGIEPLQLMMKREGPPYCGGLRPRLRVPLSRGPNQKAARLGSGRPLCVIEEPY